MERKIAIVQDNYDKARTYAEQIGRYKKAVKEGFYFEALLIEYAMIEDRTMAFLYHCGIQLDRGDVKISKIAKQKLLKIILPPQEGKQRAYSLNGLGKKTEMIRAIIEWECTTEQVPDDRYLKMLKSQCESLDAAAFQKTLEDIDKWKAYRNEVIHGLLNKNMDALGSDLEDNVNNGMRLARELDAQVRVIKKNNRIRKAANLPVK